MAVRNKALDKESLMTDASDIIREICGRTTTREMSSKAQCRECKAVIPISLWTDGAIMTLDSTPDVGGGAGEDSDWTFVCPACGERDTKNDLTIDQLFEIEEAAHTDTE